MNPDEKKEHIEWLQHRDIRTFLMSDEIPSPWFPAFKFEKSDVQRIRWFSALVPPDSIPQLLKKSSGWDIGPLEGVPSVWTYYAGEETTLRYCPFGNTEGIEPLVIWRDFHGMREDFLELAQEFRLYHNLYPEPARRRYVAFDKNGDESEAARYGDGYMEIRTDLLRRFCAEKQMGLAVYVESHRHSHYTLSELGVAETREVDIGDRYRSPLTIVSEDPVITEDFKSCGLLIGGKKYVLPGPVPTDDEPDEDVFQEFIIRTDSEGNIVRHTCDPDTLANYFGANPGAPHYLTPVFFRAEVLEKYYGDPKKYSVEDGYLRCGGLWGLRMDNDHDDYVVVWLGDLGRDLFENERIYWLSFNIPPEGRRISHTNFQRAFKAEFADPARPDLRFKQSYTQFNEAFYGKWGWEFFLPLHPDDEHFLAGLHLLSKDSQREFDSQLLSLTKILVDSLNEKKIAEGVTTLTANDKGITKLAKFFSERGLSGFEPHLKFLRVLQDLRSKSAAHRKGTNYDRLITDLNIADDGQQRVFGLLLSSAVELVSYLQKNLLTPDGDDDCVSQ